MANSSPISSIQMMFSYNDPDDPQSKVEYAYLDSVRSRGLLNILQFMANSSTNAEKKVEIPNGLRIQAVAVLSEIKHRSR